MDSGSSSSGVVVLWSRLFAVGLAVAMAALSPGCKGSGSQDPPAASGAAATTGAPSAEPAVDPAILAYAQHQIDLAYAGTDRDPPTTAPSRRRARRSGSSRPSQIGESASVATNAAKEAGELVGWKMTLFDAKGDPAEFLGRAFARPSRRRPTGSSSTRSTAPG